MPTTTTRRQPLPKAKAKAHICFWLDTDLHRDYIAALQAKASTISLDLRANIKRVVAEHQAAVSAAAKKD